MLLPLSYLFENYIDIIHSHHYYQFNTINSVDDWLRKMSLAAPPPDLNLDPNIDTPQGTISYESRTIWRVIVIMQEAKNKAKLCKYNLSAECFRLF
jgi:hypothetical protein